MIRRGLPGKAEALSGTLVHGLELRRTGRGMLVEALGELDLHALEDLRRVLDAAVDPPRTEPSDALLPSLVDLSGVSFLDLRCARELVVRSQVHAHRIALKNPSPSVLHSIRAFGLEAWFRFTRDPAEDLPESPRLSPEGA